jgi:hypothetical protein
MITEIGVAAGEIWKLLDEKGRLELSEVVKENPHKRELMLMALGWLCREGHILLVQGGGKIFAELREPHKFPRKVSPC